MDNRHCLWSRWGSRGIPDNWLHFRSHIKPPPIVMREWYGRLFSAQRSSPDSKMQGKLIDMGAEAVQQKLFVKSYRGSHDAPGSAQCWRGPLLDKWAAFPICFWSFTVSSRDLFINAFPVHQVEAWTLISYQMVARLQSNRANKTTIV